MKSFITNPVLVLNTAWLRIRICSVAKAIRLVCRDRARIIDAEGENPTFLTYNWEDWIKLPFSKEQDIIRGPHISILRPKVIVLKYFNSIPQYGLRLSKKNIMARDNYTCQYTGQKLLPNEADIDHVKPKSKGGTNSWDNVVTCDKKINRKKADKTVQEAGLHLLSTPHKPSKQKLYFDKILQDKRFPQKILDHWKFFLIK